VQSGGLSANINTDNVHTNRPSDTPEHAQMRFHTPMILLVTAIHMHTLCCFLAFSHARLHVLLIHCTQQAVKRHQEQNEASHRLLASALFSRAPKMEDLRSLARTHSNASVSVFARVSFALSYIPILFRFFSHTRSDTQSHCLTVSSACCSVLQCVALCCVVLQCVFLTHTLRHTVILSHCIFCATVCCSVLQCVA